ncbi:MAG: MerR family transcriptional regulator [Candidatus Obscuribacterales bacterium]|nr:MerR family transcriptional regulator [Candidatus Obscuribacterales bacterium]
MVADDATFSVDGLTKEVARLLQERGLLSVQQDQRVSSNPDVRTIRYYTSLGLIDRPKMDGRQARYGERHVLQILAIKALQSVSLPLSEIQSLLYGSTDEELENVVDTVRESNRVKRKLLGKETFKATLLREIVIEPGLKLVAEAGWSPEIEETVILDRIKAALVALKAADDADDGGAIDERKEDQG